MLRFLTHDRLSNGRLARREWLRIGGLASLGALARLSRADESGPRAAGFGRARSVIMVYASGGQSQIDMWDPKPLAPAEIRGEFAAIQTSVPGTFLCEHMPKIARLADRFTILRSVSHDDLDHGSAGYLTLTGRYHPRKSSNPDPSPTDAPTLGAILRRVRPTNRFLYDAVHVNGPALVPELIGPGQDGGLLGREFEPMVVGDISQSPLAIEGLADIPDLSSTRLTDRQALKHALDARSGTLDERRALQDMDRLYDRAFDLLASPRSREAFDLSREPAALRDRYGRHRSGQACLLARRLVEAGVPWITVIWNHSNRGQDKFPSLTDEYGWDTHNDIFESLRVRLLPRFDESFSTLLEDLEERGLLDETLVVCQGEFGRAPLVAREPKFAGNTPGRKHWASVYSVVAAGAGVKRGAILGASDSMGGQPTDHRVGPWDLAATMLSALGVNHAGTFTDALGRAFPVTLGEPIRGLYHDS